MLVSRIPRQRVRPSRIGVKVDAILRARYPQFPINRASSAKSVGTALVDCPEGA
jgi:hypothetical protein